MEMLDEEEQEMAHEDAVEDVVEANDDQEPDVEAHAQDAVEDVVEANDDQEPDVEAHGWGGAVEDVVEDVVE